jgi:hypothetical protein
LAEAILIVFILAEAGFLAGVDVNQQRMHSFILREVVVVVR